MGYINRCSSQIILCVILSFPVAVHAAALYIDSDGRIMARQDKFDPGDEEVNKWSFVKSGDVISVTLYELEELKKVSVNGPKTKGRKDVAIYTSGLTISSFFLGDSNVKTDEMLRERGIGIVVDNLHGQEKVYLSDKKFILADDKGNDYPIVPCRWGYYGRNYISASPIVTPRDRVKTIICAELPVEIAKNKSFQFKFQYDDGNNDDVWVQMPNSFISPESWSLMK